MKHGKLINAHDVRPAIASRRVVNGVEDLTEPEISQNLLVFFAQHAAPFQTDNRDSVIPVASADEAEKLKTLPQRIAVLRTMNIRIDELESEVRRLQFELEALRKIKENN